MTDATIFDVGDVIQIEQEYMPACTATTPATNTLTITRGYAGTTAASHNDLLPVYLVSNSRTGAEVNVTSVSRIPQAVTQYCQTVQHAYQVGGALQADANYVTGFATPLDRDRMLAMQHVMDDFESACYYGKGVPLSSSTQPAADEGDPDPAPDQQRHVAHERGGLQAQRPGARHASGLLQRRRQPDRAGGQHRLPLRLRRLGPRGHAADPRDPTCSAHPIDLFEAPFLSGISIIPAPLLRPGTAICLSDTEVRIRLKRPMIDKPRGSRGDAFEGDIIMEGAIEVDNEAHHAWVTGVTAFAAA